VNDKQDVNKSSIKEGTEDIDYRKAEPIKQCYFLADKYFIVIDRSIVRQLNFLESGREIYFQQFVDKYGCIILRPYKMKKMVSLPGDDTFNDNDTYQYDVHPSK
jgi:hypothetical protein